MSTSCSRAVVRMLSQRHHHAEVDDLVVVAAEHHAHDVLADVVDVALDGGDEDAPLAPAARRPPRFSASMNGSEVGHRLLHHARALHHLGQEHPARAEQVARPRSCRP